MRVFILSLLSLLLAYSVYNSYQLFQLSKIETSTKYDYAEINKIKYGLFNIDIWKDKIYDIIEQQIGDFELTEDNYDVIKVQIEKYLEELYQEYFVSGKLVESLMAESGDTNNVGKILMGLFKGGIEKQLEQIDFKSKIPEISDQLILELKKKSPEIKRAISQQISDLLIEESQRELIDQRTYIFNKYDQEDYDSTNAYLEAEVQKLQSESNVKVRTCLILLIIALFILLLGSKFLDFKNAMVVLNFISIVFLALGLALPMIDLDARLSSVDISLLDQNIHFDEQIMYFQSKSILDVTKTLLESQGLDIKIVGFLILLFSIILPFAKMILSLLYLFIEKLKTKKLVNVIIFYLGKWSMADVFVVAIFMSYIGFYGLINTQIVDTGSSSAIDTINYSKLSPGIIFFTSYCILSIIMSSLIHRHYKPIKQ